MPSYSKNEIVLVRYPFSDLTNAKVRPAVIVNASHPSQDVLIVPLTYPRSDSRLLPLDLQELSPITQAYNVYRMRALGRQWQDAGLLVISNLTWSDERSFEFCFAGIPPYAPVVACECRTPGGNDEDRRAFLKGLAEAVT